MASIASWDGETPLKSEAAHLPLTLEIRPRCQACWTRLRSGGENGLLQMSVFKDVAGRRQQPSVGPHEHDGTVESEVRARPTAGKKKDVNNL